MVGELAHEHTIKKTRQNLRGISWVLCFSTTNTTLSIHHFNEPCFSSSFFYLIFLLYNAQGARGNSIITTIITTPPLEKKNPPHGQPPFTLINKNTVFCHRHLRHYGRYRPLSRCVEQLQGDRKVIYGCCNNLGEYSLIFFFFFFQAMFFMFFFKALYREIKALLDGWTVSRELGSAQFGSGCCVCLSHLFNPCSNHGGNFNQ